MSGRGKAGGHTFRSVTRPTTRREADPYEPLQRATDLADNVHAVLDRAALDAYGWPDDLNDESILERLLALNLDRASA